jgi:glyoxylase I family protein
LISANPLGDTYSVDQDPAPPSAAAFDHFGVSVTDLGRSLDFYCDVLGAVLIVPPRPVDNFNFRRAVVTLHGSTSIDLNEHATNSGETFDPSRTGLDHLGFNVSSYEALLAWAAHLDTHGVAHSPMRNIPGVGEAFDFLDPDGIQLELWHKDHSGWWESYVQKKVDQSGSDVQASVPEDS